MYPRFDGQTVLITGTGYGFGSQYATHLADRGASVVLHDNNDEHLLRSLANKINVSGGKAIAVFEDMNNSSAIIQSAIMAFGSIDALILNSAPYFNADWEATTQKEWDALLRETFSYKCVQASWEHFKKQKYGRILCTASVLPQEQSSSHPLISSATYGQLGLIQTLAREGAKHNILASVLSPSPMQEGVSADQTESLLRVVATMIHSSNTKESGHLYYFEGNLLSKTRWERARGSFLNPDSSMTSDVLLEQWNKINDFSHAQFPSASADHDAHLRITSNLPQNSATPPTITLKGSVALVTGAGSGLGRVYAKCLASLGAHVVLNDVNEPTMVAKEIRSLGGLCDIVMGSVEYGAAIVSTVLEKVGSLDIIVNNAGFVRDKSIGNMTDKLWDSVMAVHLKGVFSITKAAWPHLQKQGYGRIVNVSSTSGIYGSFGQSNYATAKCAIIGFSRALARQGAPHNILVNAIAPVATTPALVDAVNNTNAALLADYCAPFVGLLCSDAVPYPSTGAIFELAAGWHARTRLQQSRGATIPSYGSDCGPVSGFLDEVATFDASSSTYPERSKQGLQDMAHALPQNSVLSKIEQAKARKTRGTRYEYNFKDVILYNLTLNSKWTEQPLINERDAHFQVLPTFGVVPYFNTRLPWKLEELLPNYEPTQLLHGEQYLEIRKHPIPTAGKLITYPRLLRVVDKQKAAVVTTAFTTRDEETGEDIFYNESSAYIRGAGGYSTGNSLPISQSSPETHLNQPPIASPKRKADAIRQERTTEEQAVYYRLNGDYNAVHVDPSVARQGGFTRPILHGLCFFGLAGKHVFQQYGQIENIRARFAGIVLPGQTLRTEMWRERHQVVFQMIVVETGKLCISDGRVTLLGCGADGQSKL